MWEHIKCCKVLWKFITHNYHLLSAPMSLKIVIGLSPLWFNILMKRNPCLFQETNCNADRSLYCILSSGASLEILGLFRKSEWKNVSGNSKCSCWGMQIHRPLEVVIDYNQLKTHVSTCHLLVHPLKPSDGIECQILHLK